MKVKEILGLKIIKALSTLSVRNCRRLGALVGRLLWALNTEPKRVTLINLRLAYPELTSEEIESLAKQSLIDMATLVPEFAKVWHLETQEEIRSYITSVENLELLDEDGRGLIILAPHLGNWEMGGQYVASYREVSALYSPPKQQAFEDLIKNARERFGVRMYPASAKGVIGISRDLKKGRAVFVLPDQVPDTKGGIYAPFFGVPALTMTLATGLAKKTNSRIVLMGAFADGPGWKVVLQDPEDEIYSEQSDIAVAAMNRSIEKLISIDPAKYQWEYKRFKKQEDPKKRFY